MLISRCLIMSALAGIGLLPGQDKCPLHGATDGKIVTLRALVMPTAHDTLLKPVGCRERVLLEHPDPAVNGLPTTSLKRDRNFRRFTKFVTAHEKSTPTVTCKECWIYKVVADFTGRLNIAPRAGLKFDESTGKAVGMDGFGHPMPFTRYRLVLSSVANVQAKKEQSRQAEPQVGYEGEHASVPAPRKTAR